VKTKETKATTRAQKKIQKWLDVVTGLEAVIANRFFWFAKSIIAPFLKLKLPSNSQLGTTLLSNSIFQW
jgi:hypothetical protein